MAVNTRKFETCISRCDQIENSDYYIVKLEKSFCRDSNISVCTTYSDSCNLSDKLNEEAGCLCSSEESDVCFYSEGSSDEDALNDSNSFDEKICEEHQQCYVTSVCENRSENQYELDESTSSITDESSRVSTSVCVDERPSTCHGIKESESLVDQLLNQLPRTRDTDESRKYWEMMLHCERATFQRDTTNLPLPSREARFYWHLYSMAKKHSPLYQKELNSSFRITLSKLIHSGKSKKGITIWEQLVRLKTFDRIGRKNLISNLARLLCVQRKLEFICLEGLSLTPDEGIRLLFALFNSRRTMRCVYCWRAFEKSVDIGYRDEHCTYKKIDKYDWFRAIAALKFLTTLSVNYAYIATPTGDLLILLAKKLVHNWQWLQLLCTEDDIVRKCNGDTGITTNVIPDVAWRRAHHWAPKLKVQYAIIGIPNYDIHKWFYTKNTQIHSFALSTSIDFRFRQPWYLNCTFKSLYSWHSKSLVYLCLQLWHNRENLDNHLKNLVVNLPSLRVFEFIGEIRKLKTLCGMCLQIRSCSCKVHSVNMELQEVLHGDVDKEAWMKSVKCLMVCFKHDFERMGVKFKIDFYCM